jgi:hypothetical protein
MSEFPSSSLAGHYRALALDAYATARLIEDPHEKLTMQHIAHGYEHLAVIVEKRELATSECASLARKP